MICSSTSSAESSSERLKALTESAPEILSSLQGSTAMMEPAERWCTTYVLRQVSYDDDVPE